MFKFIFKTILFAVIVFGAAAIYFFGNYTLFRTKDGIHFLEKPAFSLEIKVIDTTKWSFLDFAKHPEITREITKNGWDKIKSQITDGFESLDAQIKDWTDTHVSKEKMTELEKPLKAIQSEAKKRYAELEKKAEKEGWTAKTLKRKISELGDWIQNELKKLEE